MSIVKRNGSIFPAVFDDFFSHELFNWRNNNFSTTSTTVPAVNIKETSDAFEVEVAAPGMEKNDFRVTLEDDVLTIASEKEANVQQQNGNYTRREFSYQSFQRQFELHKQVMDETKITAHYENGVLRLHIPKKEEAKQKPPRMIEIH
ncbi:Hsp20/alpha crystallin family protein [Deminuibacter soli]|uniref:Hsp20/alpha crystallin family protein n=1 Tax=Deminuibacter soli TaxID=2291815 RepID=A0A3E1NGC1_9BACT|nr:Hsp20/alpha crystallin family protein [Deminuibacter soli]RFM26838.1 Hsp20/alpha crystallin family protein [Deminuibacter soli]